MLACLGAKLLVVAADDPTIVPQANDTISQAYWTEVDNAIRAAAAGTPKPLNAHEVVTPQPIPWERVKSFQHQPIDTALGAALLYNVVPHNTQTPPPTQEYVRSAFIAQCPMLMFSNNINIRAPRCDDKSNMGYWIDPSNGGNSTVLRWERVSKGVKFGVDSASTGSGSVRFADLEESLTLSTYAFELRNCMGAKRWDVNEEVIRAEAPERITSVYQPTESTFFRYRIVAPDGNLAAESNLVALNDNTVNFTGMVSEGLPGTALMSAKRHGTWTGAGWRECVGNVREWALEFPGEANLTDGGTLMDIRIAAAAAFTLFAVRDEVRSQQTGLTPQSSRALLFGLIGLVLVAILMCIFCLNAYLVWNWSGMREHTRRGLMMFERFCLPRRSPKAREAPLRPAY